MNDNEFMLMGTGAERLTIMTEVDRLAMREIDKEPEKPLTKKEKDELFMKLQSKFVGTFINECDRKKLYHYYEVSTGITRQQKRNKSHNYVNPLADLEQDANLHLVRILSKFDKKAFEGKIAKKNEEGKKGKKTLLWFVDDFVMKQLNFTIADMSGEGKNPQRHFEGSGAEVNIYITKEDAYSKRQEHLDEEKILQSFLLIEIKKIEDPLFQSYCIRRSSKYIEDIDIEFHEYLSQFDKDYIELKKQAKAAMKSKATKAQLESFERIQEYKKNFNKLKYKASKQAKKEAELQDAKKAI